ncbi:MAG: hypothetical protein NC213_07315 [Acetobacter sp.]|nr:hypothetical protein [Bacteroides sp.]MCM1341538.1 hypothetical protein [Acetobacter sp.]MCM1433615.1 hypothetical protein [Clostridiales bacterium]
MRDLTVEQIKNADFKLFVNNPIIKPFDKSFVVADPSLLTPDNAHDRKWHMFFHTNLGIYHFISDDGIAFSKVKRILTRAMRPNTNYINGTYYLFYERTAPLIVNALTLVNLAKWHSEIYVTKSSDLINWSEPEKVLGNTRNFERSKRGLAISNPYLLRDGDRFLLYYSCGLTFIKDCGFCEPTYISCAESKKADCKYISAAEPIISPDINNPYLNLCSGCLKVYKVKDGYIGLQNGIYDENGKSKSAIILLSSKDGKKFDFEKMLLQPQMDNGKSWMKQFVYASHLVKYENKLRLYFNARDFANSIKGRECIGFCEAEI